MKAVQALTSCHDCAAAVEQATRQWRSRQEIQSIPGQEVDDEAPAAGPLDLTHSCLKTHTQTESGRGESEGGDGRGGDGLTQLFWLGLKNQRPVHLSSESQPKQFHTFHVKISNMSDLRLSLVREQSLVQMF